MGLIIIPAAIAVLDFKALKMVDYPLLFTFVFFFIFAGNMARIEAVRELFAYLLDNVFMMLQFSISCDYYKERFKVYMGEDVENKDGFIIEQTLKFVKAAFK